MTDQLYESEQLHRDRQQDLHRAKEAIAGPVPLMPPAPDTTFELPRGLYHNGTWATTVEVRELTGADEEALARVKDLGLFFDAVIAHGTVRIGDQPVAEHPIVERQTILQDLLIGERDQIFMAVIRATFGEKREISFTCGVCQTEQDVTLLLNEDFKAKVIDDLGTANYSYVTSKGDRLEYRLAIGSDQMEALTKKGATVAEQNTVILSRVIVKVNDGLLPNPLLYARNLSIRDREKLLKELVSRQPSIDLGVTTNCAGCGGEQRLNLGWSDLFRP